MEGFMSYKLYDFEGNITSFKDLQNKGFWCRKGEAKELQFVKLVAQLQKSNKINFTDTVEIHPAKVHNKYHPDLLIDGNRIGEVKTKNSPFFMADSYGITPQFALTMDLKDSFNYNKYLAEGKDIQLFIWVKWEAHRMESYGNVNEVGRLAGIWQVNFSELREFQLTTPPPIHWYKERPPRILGEQLCSIWREELANFEPRLLSTNGTSISSITTRGFVASKTGELFPSGNSSCSYVFDLSKPPFTPLYTNIRANK